MRKNYYWMRKENNNFLSELKNSELTEINSAKLLSPIDKAYPGAAALARDGVHSNRPISSLVLDSEIESENTNSNEFIQTSPISPISHTAEKSNFEFATDSSNVFIQSVQSPHSHSSNTQLFEIEDESNLAAKLKCWYNKFNIPLVAFKGLLEILKPHHPQLPNDPRTLLKTKSLEIENFSTGGEFTYYGLSDGIKNNCHFDVTQVDTIKIDCFIDGVPIFKSRNTSFWPIICSCSNSIDYKFNQIYPFLVAIFYGERKPNIQEYLDKFISELKELLECGIFINDKHYKVILRSVIADAPARAFLKQIKSHGGYHCCDRCVTKGIYKNKSMSYNEINAVKRDNDSFRSKADEYHHTGTSPFINLDIDMITCFVYDYLHVILLGIVRKLLSLFWHKVPYKLSVAQKNLIDEKIKKIKKYFPIEFTRKPRTFNELERFKGSEFRTILLYSGPIIFSDVLPAKMFNNFLILMYIIRIFCTEELLCDENIKYAQELTVVFVKQFSRIYKNANVTYNVHSLIHIADDVKKYGVLDSFSGFPYESFLGAIKKKIRSSSAPLAQINRRITEGYEFNKKNYDIRPNGLLIKGHTVLPNEFANSIVILKDKSIASVKEITKNSIKICKYKKSTPYFKYPTCSSLLDIFSVDPNSTEILFISKCDIDRKGMIIPQKKYFVFFPLI